MFAGMLISIFFGYFISEITKFIFKVDLPAIKFYIFGFLIPLLLFLLGILSKTYLGIIIFPEFLQSFPEKFTENVAIYMAGVIIGLFMNKLWPLME